MIVQNIISGSSRRWYSIVFLNVCRCLQVILVTPSQYAQRCSNICVCVLVSGATIFVILGCEKHDKPLKVYDTISSDYLEIYDLKQNKNNYYSIDMIGPDGTKWYRGMKPIIDLSMIEIDKTYVERYAYDGGGYGIIICIKEQYDDNLAKWSEANIGGYGGVVIRGKLLNVDKIMSRIQSRMFIKLSSQEEASEVASEIRMGGISSSNAK